MTPHDRIASFDPRPYEKLRTTPLNKLRILLSNDDGFYAPGLKVLERVARTLSDDIWIVAPEAEQSGAGHSLSINSPLRLIKHEERRYAVTGTPTDCVLLAAKVLFAKDGDAATHGEAHLPDLILSGVNRGGNLGEDVTYSGTIAAAMEGTLLDIPSIAFSQTLDDYEHVPWDVAEAHAARVIREVCRIGWQANTLINVNFPLGPADKVKGIKVAPHGRRKIGDKLLKNADPKGRPYYWIGGDPWNRVDEPNTDIAVVTDNYISITPISMDMTNYTLLERMQAGFDEGGA